MTNPEKKTGCPIGTLHKSTIRKRAIDILRSAIVDENCPLEAKVAASICILENDKQKAFDPDSARVAFLQKKLVPLAQRRIEEIIHAINTEESLKKSAVIDHGSRLAELYAQGLSDTEIQLLKDERLVVFDAKIAPLLDEQALLQKFIREGYDLSHLRGTALAPFIGAVVPKHIGI